MWAILFIYEHFKFYSHHRKRFYNLGTWPYSYPTMHVLSVTDGYAPFLSMTSRETFLNISDQVVAAPGPGHYDPRFAQDNVKVGMHQNVGNA